MSLFGQQGYILGPYLQDAQNQPNDAVSKQLLDIDDKMMLLMDLMQGKTLKMFPYTSLQGTTEWFAPTDRMPKALVPVDGQPLLWHTIHRLVEVGAEELVVNVHHFGQQIIDYLAEHEWPVPIHVSDEREALLDTGGGLRRAIPLFAERDVPILIHNVDILSDAPLRAFYAESADVDVQLMVSRRDTQRYLLFDERMRLVGWTNVATGEVRSPHADLDVNACRKLAFSGIHCVSPRLRETMVGYPPAFPIMQFYLEQCDRLNIRGYEVEHLHLLDVGKVQTLAVAEDFVRKTLPSEL